MNEKVTLYAVVRFDYFLVGVVDDLARAFTVKEVLPTLEMAEQEVDRLNRLNEDNEQRYFLQTARYYPDGSKGQHQGNEQSEVGNPDVI